MTITVFNDIGLDEYALFLVQDRDNQMVSVFTTVTQQNSLARAQAVVFPAPTPGEFRIVMDQPGTQNSVSEIGSSEEFKVVSGNGGITPSLTSSLTFATSGSSSERLSDSLTSSMPQLPQGSVTSRIVTVTASLPSVSSTSSDTSKHSSKAMIAALTAVAGLLLLGTMTTCLICYRRLRRKQVESVGIEPYNTGSEQSAPQPTGSYNFLKSIGIHNSKRTDSRLGNTTSGSQSNQPYSATVTGDSSEQTSSEKHNVLPNEAPLVERRRGESRIHIHTDSGWRAEDSRRSIGSDIDEERSIEVPPSYTSS
ncbi:hypothetical protein K435DRAFT_864507 [Dendrothele bispora CBS 962.96]|uniref:Mid2 domain-containing protein n=1 Tax=Dendrothele bispora (strain CBS 962.96) TaxID=1314807 RepID=A0A4S8LME8_DENBC|nr:hypothetical protein K435DRAFT_864507 [Dendrothele bispora CBS 962.96]